MKASPIVLGLSLICLGIFFSDILFWVGVVVTILGIIIEVTKKR